MRVLILGLSVLAILFSADAAKAGLSTTTRDLSASVDPATFTEEANQETEDQIGLNKGKRRAVQRRLTGLGFYTKVNGKFDESTRAVIARWQAAHGYPNTGFLNTLQHKALLTESVSAVHASTSDETDNDRPARRRGGGAHHHRGGGGGGGPIRLIGGMVGGLFGRR
jgi:peptidoglycan hydrolase-like protein with peptidoglycan-binding domain